MIDRTVMVIDDDEAVIESMSMLLEDEGYRVIQARNGADALNLLATQRPAGILLDLMMPVMDGFEFRKKQLDDASLAAIPTIVLTAGAVDHRVRNLHATACFRKPFAVTELLVALEEQVGTRAQDRAGPVA